MLLVPVSACVVASAAFNKPPFQKPGPLPLRCWICCTDARTDLDTDLALTAFTANVAQLNPWNALWLPKTRTHSTPTNGTTRFRENRPVATSTSAVVFTALAAFLPTATFPRLAFAEGPECDCFFGTSRGLRCGRSGSESLPPRRPGRIRIRSGPTRHSLAKTPIAPRANPQRERT